MPQPVTSCDQRMIKNPCASALPTFIAVYSISHWFEVQVLFQRNPIDHILLL